MKKKRGNHLDRILLGEFICVLFLSVVMACLAKATDKPAAGGGNVLTPTGTVTPTATVRLTITAAPTDEQELTVTITPANTITPTAEPTPAGKPTPTAVPTPTKKPEPTAVPTPTKKPEPTAVPTPTKKPTPTVAPTATPTPAVTAKPTITPTPTPIHIQTGGNVAEKPGMDMEFIHSLEKPLQGDILTGNGSVRTVYYMQTDPRWGNEYYGGEDTIAKYACGPTSMAMVVSSLTNIGIDPLQMSRWAKKEGYWYPQSGSLHSIINGAAKAFGLSSEGVGNDQTTEKKVLDALRQGDMVVALMGKGHFTRGGHFIVLRGITAEGKILVADGNSRSNTETEWDFSLIQSEVKWASDGGPFWIIRNPNRIQ